MNSRRFQTFIFCIFMILRSQNTEAELEQEMDAVFNSMVNTTAPSAHTLQRRGVLSGGSVVVRNRIMNTNPISMVPPSFGAGCGGIDLDGGSFSFINQNQFVTLMRSIASNAGGYAFQLAINAMCPDCGNVMSDLQKKIQQFNQMFSNSCQLAQGIVNDGVSAMDTQNKSRMSNLAFTKGISDVFGSWTSAGTQGDPVQQIRSSAPDALVSQIQGNLVWRSLNQANAGTWFQFGGTQLLEASMSVTGTIILKAPIAPPDGKGENTPITYLPPILRVHDLLIGSGPTHTRSIKIYHCDTAFADGCLNPTTEDINLTGFSTEVLTILLGTATQGGLITKFGTNNGALTDREKAFMEVTPNAMGALIRNLARTDISIAKLFAQEAAPILALDLAQELIQAMLDAVRTSMSLSGHPYARKLDDALLQVRMDLRDEYQALSGKIGNSQSLMSFYQDLVSTIKPRSYGSTEQIGATPLAYPSR